MTEPEPTLSPAGTLAADASFAKGAVEACLHRAYELLLARELDAGDLTAAWELCRHARLDAPAKAAGFFFVLAALFEARRQGDTRLALGGAEVSSGLEALRDEHLEPADAAALISFITEELVPTTPASPGVATLLGPPEAAKPLVRIEESGGLISLAFRRDVAKEQRLAHASRDRSARAQSWSESEIAEALAAATREARPLVPEQERAVVQSLTRHLALVAGGPGTGKTTIILTLVRTAMKLGLAPSLIALAAPTGKAARRIEEALGELRQTGLGDGLGASTLHALLGLGPDLAPRPLFRASAPLPHRLVIVDEASMIGLDNLDLLFEAVAPQATLVLLGDPDQLPSVEAGAMFRALVEAPALSALRLTQSHRMRADDPAGASILRLAQEVRSGTWPASLPSPAREGPLPDAGVHLLPLATGDGDAVEPKAKTSALHRANDSAFRAGLARFFARWQGQHLGWQQAIARETWSLSSASFPSHQQPELAALLDAASRTRLLAVTRGHARPTGVAAINEWFHVRTQAASPSMYAAVARFLPGEPVMITENDPERGLANGDAGVVLSVRAGRGPSTMAVIFVRGDDLAVFPLAGLERRLALAYAVTVHKAQGSEHDHVALLLPPDELPLFGRELLYTALTRARRSVLLVGPAVRAAEAAARATQRRGSLTHWLNVSNAAL